MIVEWRIALLLSWLVYFMPVCSKLLFSRTRITNSFVLDDVDKLACAGNFGPKLVRFLDKYLHAPDLLCMLATALSQFPSDISIKGCLTQSLTDLPALFRCAFAHFWEWSTLMPLVMCILQAVSSKYSYKYSKRR